MIIQLENDALLVSIDTQGAEVHSLMKKDQTHPQNPPLEYLWQGDPAYWGRRAPILFPIVGKLMNNSYKLGGATYALGQHGFARDRAFGLVLAQKDRASFRLVYDDESLKVYPYQFELFVHYAIEKENLWIAYEVKNLDEQPIYFSIGAHPGFRCPLEEGESFEDYYFEFERPETASIYPLSGDGTLSRDEQPFLNHERCIPLTKNLFEKDALVFHYLASTSVALRSHRSKRQIAMDFTGFPFLGLWSKPTGAPFVCIEPWFGHADFIDDLGATSEDFTKKEGLLKLKVASTFTCHYTISLSDRI